MNSMPGGTIRKAVVLTSISILFVTLTLLVVGVLRTYGPLLRTLVPLRTAFPLRKNDHIGESIPFFFSFDPETARGSEELYRRAESMLTRDPFSVTHKAGVPRGGSLHDFYTLSPFFWPNGITPGGRPYIYRDGRKNPEADSDRYDRVRLSRFKDSLMTLSAAYHFSGDERYGQQASRLLRVWFLGPSTRMNPHLANAQAMPGLTEGWSWGMIRLRDFAEICDAVRLIEDSPYLPESEYHGLQAWYRELLNWIAVHPFGRREYRKPNNHGTWFDASVSSIALFVGDTETARVILAKSGDLRIKRAIGPDGAQPMELVRSKPIHYSIFNLEALMIVIRAGQVLGIDIRNFEEDDRSSVDRSAAGQSRESRSYESRASNYPAGAAEASILAAIRWLYDIYTGESTHPALDGSVLEADLDDRNRRKLRRILSEYTRLLRATGAPIPGWMQDFSNSL
jgi:hypothetical protein